MKYDNPLGKEKVFTLLMKFSIPAIVGMVVNALYNIVDRMFIGRSKDLAS
ncbi:MAG TPA: MATE family efflux transporter, partial [Clostridium sp.]|nr:MATE family efflux transporter [Clostridium sp.]